MKNFRFDQVPNSSLIKIAFEGGGEVPDELKGYWTNMAVAKQAIEVWKSNNPERADVKVSEKNPHEDKKGQKVEYKALGDM